MRHTKVVAALELLIPTSLYAKGLTDRDDLPAHSDSFPVLLR